MFVARITTSTVPAVSEPAEEFKIALRAEFGGIAVKGKWVEEAIANEMKTKNPPRNDEMLSPDVTYVLKNVSALDEAGYAAKTVIEYRGSVIPQLPLDELKSQILGKKENKARLFLLSQRGVKDVQFDYQWNLLLAIPDNPKKVILSVQ